MIYSRVLQFTSEVVVDSRLLDIVVANLKLKKKKNYFTLHFTIDQRFGDMNRLTTLLKFVYKQNQT